MQIRYVVLITLFSPGISNVNAQRVKRKGVDMNEVSRNQRGKNATMQGPVFTLEQLGGKWQEISREDLNKAPVAIKDTIYLNFTAPNKVITRDGTHANMIGEAAIDAPGNVLLAAADVYTILSVTADRLILDDQDAYIHTFGKTDSFSFEKYGNLSVSQDEYKTPIQVNIPSIMGNWSVYRRQAKPGAINPPTNIIRFIKVSKQTNDSSATGEITFYKSQQSQALPCNIAITGSRLIITAGENKWDLLVYKADGKEWVLGDADVLLYYAKPDL